MVIGTAQHSSFVLDTAATALRQIPVDPLGVAGDEVQPSVLALLQPRADVLWIAAFGGIDVIDADSASCGGSGRIRRSLSAWRTTRCARCCATVPARSGIGGYGGGLQRRHDPANEAMGVLHRHSPGRAHTLQLAKRQQRARNRSGHAVDRYARQRRRCLGSPARRRCGSSAGIRPIRRRCATA